MTVKVVRELRRGGHWFSPGVVVQMDAKEAFLEILAGRVVPVTSRQADRLRRETR